MEQNNKNSLENKNDIFKVTVILIIIGIITSLAIQIIDSKKNITTETNTIKNKNIINYLILIQETANLILIGK